jgi:hypothetical protein
MEQEIWRDIKGYKGIYQVSNFGRIKGLERLSAKGCLLKEKIRKIQTNNDGYQTVILFKDGIRGNYDVHRLVAVAFISNPDNLPQVNHKDECKHNNYVANLEWCTGKYNSNYGTGSVRRVLVTDFKAAAIKRRKPVIATNIKTGEKIYFESIHEAGRSGFKMRVIHFCLCGKCKTHQGYVWRLAS